MPPTVVHRTARPGRAPRLDAAWRLKERINDETGVLAQSREYFDREYRYATTHLLLADDTSPDGISPDVPPPADTPLGDPSPAVVGFAVVHDDGYLSLLAVAPERQGEGHGRRLVETVAADHPTVTLHTRTDNGDAIGFYEYLGFEIERRVPGFYGDGDDAFVLRLGA